MHLFEVALEWSRRHYDFYVIGYVVMPEHVHLLVSEPEHGTLASAVQAIKQSLFCEESGSIRSAKCAVPPVRLLRLGRCAYKTQN